MKTSKTLVTTKLKFFQVLIVALLCIGITACDNEGESSPQDDPSALVGVWNVAAAVTANCTDASENGSFALICTATDCLSVEFKSDGTFVGTELEDGVTFTENGTYSVSGDQLTITQGGMAEVATFSIDGNTLTLSGNEPETGCDVTTSLTKTS